MGSIEHTGRVAYDGCKWGRIEVDLDGFFDDNGAWLGLGFLLGKEE